MKLVHGRIPLWQTGGGDGFQIETFFPEELQGTGKCKIEIVAGLVGVMENDDGTRLYITDYILKYTIAVKGSVIVYAQNIPHNQVVLFKYRFDLPRENPAVRRTEEF
jgi:hypothetical protein